MCRDIRYSHYIRTRHDIIIMSQSIQQLNSSFWVVVVVVVVAYGLRNLSETKIECRKMLNRMHGPDVNANWMNERHERKNRLDDCVFDFDSSTSDKYVFFVVFVFHWKCLRLRRTAHQCNILLVAGPTIIIHYAIRARAHRTDGTNHISGELTHSSSTYTLTNYRSNNNNKIIKMKISTMKRVSERKETEKKTLK